MYKYFPSYQHTTVVCGGGGLNKYQPAAADAFQRPLLRRFRFQARLSRSVSLHYAPHGQSTAPARTDADTID